MGFSSSSSSRNLIKPRASKQVIDDAATARLSMYMVANITFACKEMFCRGVFNVWMLNVQLVNDLLQRFEGWVEVV